MVAEKCKDSQRGGRASARGQPPPFSQKEKTWPGKKDAPLVTHTQLPSRPSAETPDPALNWPAHAHRPGVCHERANVGKGRDLIFPMLFFFHLNVDIWRPLNTSEKCKSCKTHQRVVLGLAGARVSGCPLHRGGKTWLCTRVISPVAHHPRPQGGQATLCLMHPRENVGQRPHAHCVALTVFNSYLRPFLLSF